MGRDVESITKGRSPKTDPVLVALGAMASSYPGLEDTSGPRAYALEQILGEYNLRSIKVKDEHGREVEMPWGLNLMSKLKAWELVKAGKALGHDFVLGLALRPERKLTLEEALRLLGL